MVKHCVVRGCKSVWYPGCNIIFHRFPKDERRRNQWIAAITLKSAFYESASICNLHFEKSDYLTNKPHLLNNKACPHYKEYRNVTNTSIFEINYENHPQQQDKQIQVTVKTKLEKSLEHKNKILAQKLNRHKKVIHNMKSILKVIKNYSLNSEIDNILQGNFSEICKLFKNKTVKSHGVRYNDEVKAFALTLNFYSPKAYEFLSKYISLPHVSTLRKISNFNCNVPILTEV